MVRKKQRFFYWLCVIVFCSAIVGLFVHGVCEFRQKMSAKNTQEALQTIKEETAYLENEESGLPVAGVTAVFVKLFRETMEVEEANGKSCMLPEYEQLYEMNSDIIGWLSIEDTNIDYPVMQTPEDEEYYLDIDFYGESNKNGCLIMDTDSEVGIGIKASNYAGGKPPSTNLIIHGHTMKSGEMFGNLKFYADEAYGKVHSSICFDSLYEERKYELIAVFYSQVFYERDEVFKYYKFFQADTQEEFDDWYRNIKEMSLYDTGISAEFGDEFLTLSCCAYHVEDGRFVVVGKRIE